MTELKVMRFGTPAFNQNGLNLTIRKGFDWFIEDGNEFSIVDSISGIEKGIGFIETTKTTYLPKILAKTLSLEHLYHCRNYYGLLRELKKYYPGFDENKDIVTLVFFRIEEWFD